MSADPLTLLTFNGVTFASRSDRPFNSSGYVVQFKTLDGWYESSPDGTEAVDHWSGIGSLVEDEGLDARTIRVRGLIRAETPEAALVALDVLSSRQRGTFRVDEAVRGLSREVTARRLSFVPERITPTFWSYSLTVLADDPLRYTAASRTLTNGSNNISNAGGEHASPTLTLVGPHSALTIVHPDGTYQFAALASGQERVLDFRNGDVWNASTRVFGVESGPRPVVRSGGSTWTVSGLGAGSATLTRFAAWS